MTDPKPTRSDMLCSFLLRNVRSVYQDQGVSLTSVSRSSLTHSTVVKFTTPQSERNLEVVQRLREAFPLFSVCSIECLLTGASATSIHVPNKDEQFELALEYARKLPVSQFLLGVQSALVMLSIGSFIVVAWARFALV